VPQESQINFPYTVAEIVLMGRATSHSPFVLEDEKDFEIARASMELTDCLSLSDRYLHELSGGEKQRVIIASTIAQIWEPPAAGAHVMLLLDEPTTALDLGYLLETQELLRTLHRDLPLTIVISTHDLNFAAALCETIVLIRDGRVRAAGSTRDVLTAGNIQDIYGVDADVRHHPAAGHLVVVPVGRRRDSG
jgi:iron complex transport system ATP-binding protein